MANQKKSGKAAIKIIKIIGNSLFWTLLILSYIIGINGLIGRFIGKNDVGFLGIKALVCESGSMSYVNSSNQDYLEGVKAGFIDVGDLVVVSKPESSDSLKVGDIVTYTNTSGQTVLHRIVGIKEIDGEIYFSLRGDANNVNDPKLVRFSSVTGKFVFKIGKVGYAIKFLQSPYGIIALASTLFIILLHWFICTLIDEKKAKMQG